MCIEKPVSPGKESTKHAEVRCAVFVVVVVVGFASFMSSVFNLRPIDFLHW